MLLLMTTIQLVLIALASAAAGLVNALAGGGTLITFPTLISLGFPAIAANVTNTVALVPGYLGATITQSKDLRGQEKRLIFLLPAGLIGGLIGGLLLLNTGEKLFRSLVPYLILLASGLLAIQDPIRSFVQRRAKNKNSKNVPEAWTALPVGFAGIYGGYFGAGLSVIVLAVLGLMLDESLTRLNAVKQAIAFSVNITAAVLFIFSGKVVWSAALVMAVGALIGGALGGRLAGRIKPAMLRWIVVSIGLIVGLIYLIRN
jgi:uncharacterized membrane protein YfcA